METNIICTKILHKTSGKVSFVMSVLGLPGFLRKAFQDSRFVRPGRAQGLGRMAARRLEVM